MSKITRDEEQEILGFDSKGNCCIQRELLPSSCVGEMVSSKLRFFCYEQFSLLHLILKLMAEVRGPVGNLMAMSPAKF